MSSVPDGSNFTDTLGDVLGYQGSSLFDTNGTDPWLTSQNDAQATSDAQTAQYAYDWGSLQTNGTWDLAKIAAQGLTLAGAIAAYNQAKAGSPPTGYQGGIPSYTATRSTVPTAPGARPGAGGQRYFTDVDYATAAGIPAALAATQTQATNLLAQNQQRAQTPAPAAAPTPEQLKAQQDQFFGRVPPAAPPVQAAQGGLMGLARGGMPGAPRYLQGNTDGMADKIPATIDGQQPAALAHGEFVVPADVVSHLGNGNSDAGAQHLYSMMDRIRKARTGNKNQGKQIDPNKFTGGGIAYAAGGPVQHFDTGGTTVNTQPTGNGIVGTESNLSNWAGPYVTNMLGQGQALSQLPYQAYQGPLTAGDSSLQTQAYQDASGLQTPAAIGQAGATAGNIAGNSQTSSFTAPGTAQQYMSPYEQNVVQQQQTEAQRTADIATTARQSQQTQQGAFGGSRAAVMDAEAARNLAIQQGTIQATGDQNAFTNAQTQFNTEQTTGLAGLNTQLNAANVQGNMGVAQNTAANANLSTMAGLGATQQATTQAGVAADQAAFNAERDNPYKMVQYQQSLLQGLPLAAQSYNINTNPYAAAANVVSGVNSLAGGTNSAVA